MEGYTYTYKAQGCAKYCKPEDFAEKSQQSSSVKAAALKLHILWEIPFLDKSVLIYCVSDNDDCWYYYLP